MQVPINCHCESFVRIKKQIITLSFSTFAAFGAHIPHEYLIDKQNPFEALINKSAQASHFLIIAQNFIQRYGVQVPPEKARAGTV